MAFEITYCNLSKDPQSKVLAEFGVRIPEWDLNFSKMKLIRSSLNKEFVAGPSYKTTDATGKEMYRDYWYFGKTLGPRFKESILKAIMEHINPLIKTDNMSEEQFKEELF